jgi:hypothetical protein
LKFVAVVVTMAGETMGIHCPTPPRPFPD